MSNILTEEPPLSDKPKSGPVPGQVFFINQYEVDVEVKNIENSKCKEFDIKVIGLIKVKGKACLDPPTISVCISAFGFDLGCVEGNLKTGVTLSVDLLLVKGYLRFYLQGDCVWMKYDLTLTGIGSTNYHGDVKLFCF